MKRMIEIQDGPRLELSFRRLVDGFNRQCGWQFEGVLNFPWMSDITFSVDHFIFEYVWAHYPGKGFHFR